MVNVDDERTQKAAVPEGAGSAPRAGGKAQARGGVLTPFKDEDADPQEGPAVREPAPVEVVELQQEN